MRKNFTLLLLTALFALVACDYNESSVVIDTTQKQQDAIVDGKIPLNRAISNADFVFRNTEALGHKNRKIKSVDVLTKTNSRIVSTRSSVQNEQDAPLAYVVNYENNEGFAILAADTKLPPVISIGDEGNFDTEGFVNFIQNNSTTRSNEEVNPAQMVQYAVVNNSLLLPPTVDIVGPQIQGVDTTIILKCMPLVKTKWHQNSPYDYYSPDDTANPGEKCAAGCVPVAAAQTLAALCYHHNWRPSTQLSDEYYMNWYILNRIIFDDIIGFPYFDESANALAVASFIRALGEDLNADYGTETEANILALKNTYDRLGMQSVRYGNEDSFIPIKKNKIFDMIISKNFPVTTFARRETRGTTKGHAFVLDGWLRLEYSLLTFKQISVEQPAVIQDNVQHNFDLVHVNFGWGGQSDGYYLPDAFDLNADKYREYAEMYDSESYMSYVYDLDVQYVIFQSLEEI